MIYSPKKEHGVEFLRSLIENNFISPSGREYCEEETRAAYIETAANVAEREANRLHAEMNRQAKELAEAEKIAERKAKKQAKATAKRLATLAKKKRKRGFKKIAVQIEVNTDAKNKEIPF